MGRTAGHLVRENEVLRIDLPDALPEGWIAVAENGEGDLLLPAPHDDIIRAWDHETGTLTPATVDWSTNGRRIGLAGPNETGGLAVPSREGSSGAGCVVPPAVLLANGGPSFRHQPRQDGSAGASSE